MAEVIHILWGAGFTAAVAWAMGRLLLLGLAVRLKRGEEHLFAFVSGAACLSLYVFLLCLVHQARKGVFLWTGLACIGLAIWRSRRSGAGKPLAPAPRIGLILFAAVFAAFFVRYFFTALAPEISPDGAAYHLGNVNRYWLSHGFVWSHHNMYSYLSHGLEMLFLVAFSFGRHSAAAMVHFVFQAVLPLLLLQFGRRTGNAWAGIFAAIVVYASPVVGIDGASAYNDVALATVLVAVFYLLQVWDEDQDHKLLLVIGILCGFAYGIKYTAATATILAAGFVAWRIWRRQQPLLRPLGTLAAATALFAAPWAIRNWIWLGNPAAPFLNRWFPNPYYHLGMEKIYTDGLRHYEGIEHWWQVPLELTIHGGAGVSGLLGPVFLLAPLALLALRYSLGRRLLLAAACFAVPAFFNTGTRFLLPAAPFLALAMGLALQRPWGVLPALALFHAVFSWPPLLATYAVPYAWRLPVAMPVAAALRRVPPAGFISDRIAAYPLAYRIEKLVPPGGRIFSCSGPPEAYINREVLISYESAEANLLYEILLAPVNSYRPSLRLVFRFPPQQLEAIRAVQTAASPQFWTVAELRVLAGGREVPRSAGWRLRSKPNGWEVPLAFDNAEVTRWSSWQKTRPGQFVEAAFPAPLLADSVAVECSYEPYSKLRLEGKAPGAGWRTLADAPQAPQVLAVKGMRRDAMLEFKARGVAYLLVEETDFVWRDMQRYRAFWGVKELGAAGGVHLLRID
jgi:hypothetical protein